MAEHLQRNINLNPPPMIRAIDIDTKTGAPKVAVIDAQPQRKDIAK